MKRIMMLVVTVLILVGCVHINRFDDTTYKYLTFTKADVVGLYLDKIGGTLDGWDLRAEIILNSMNRMLEYETNKKKNKDMATQFKALKEIYVTHIRDKDWDELEQELYMDTIKLAFDGCIDTENSKSRGSIF